MNPPRDVPTGVWVTTGFFVASGLLEVAVGLWPRPRPAIFWTAWEALGRAGFDLLLAFGLWRRLALGRSVAMVYCLAALATYGVVLGLALVKAPLRFPPIVVAQSLLQIPSCALLFPFLRSPRASALFPRPLF